MVKTEQLESLKLVDVKETVDDVAKDHSFI